jgi:hypothetical protein
MQVMRCTPIDPREQTWQDDAPSYRVFLWDRHGGACEEWEISEADVDEVLAWTDDRTGDGSASVWVVQHRADRVGHIRLRGVDPTAPADTWPRWATP